MSLEDLTNLQKEILSSLYTRHHDGFVRERHLRQLLGVDEPWLPPFVIRLLGEYVVEICELIADRVGAMPRETYAKFAMEKSRLHRTDAQAGCQLLGLLLQGDAHRAVSGLSRDVFARLVDRVRSSALITCPSSERKTRWLRRYAVS